MPANYIEEYAGVSVEIEGDLEDNRLDLPVVGKFTVPGLFEHHSVYFTDQSPSFDIVVTNNSGHRIYGDITVQMAYGPDRHDVFVGENIEIDLRDGEVMRTDFGIGFLPYQDDGIIRVQQLMSLTEQAGEYGKQLKTSNTFVELYTFTVWDRDFYRINYEIPRFAQVSSAALAVVVIIIGLMQIILEFF